MGENMRRTKRQAENIRTMRLYYGSEMDNEYLGYYDEYINDNFILEINNTYNKDEE